MTEFRIFYAWQSDRPANLCRSLIRNALDEAKKQIQANLAIDEARRIDVEIDQDTQGKPGSPPVAETIFRKIRESDAFVADLTFTGGREGKPGSPVPNPNVLIEYGYALRALGEERVIAVFNEEFGKCDYLPFDLRHRSWPIRYRTTGAGSDQQAQAVRRDERKKLAKELAWKIRDVAQNAGPKPGESSAVEIRPLVEEFPLAKGVFLGDPGKRHPFPRGSKILLSLRSRHGDLQLTNKEVRDTALRSLFPLAWRYLRGTSFARVQNGAAKVEHPGSDNKAVQNASILLLNGNLYGIDCQHVGPHKRAHFPDPYVPAQMVETILRDGLHNFLEVATQQLDLGCGLN